MNSKELQNENKSLKEKIEHLEKRIEYLERSILRKESTIAEYYSDYVLECSKNEKLIEKWNKLYKLVNAPQVIISNCTFKDIMEGLERDE